jgi:hypothetical protein
MRTWVVAVVAAGLLGGELRAQESAVQAPAARPITQAVERLFRQPDFRLNVTAERPVELWVKPRLVEPEDKLQPTPRGTYYHTEYLRMTTPEAFRASTLYPMVSVGVDPGALMEGFRRAWQSWQEERIRTRVERELDEFLADRHAAPDHAR